METRAKQRKAEIEQEIAKLQEELEIINNEAWRKLPEVVKQKIRDIVSEKKS